VNRKHLAFVVIPVVYLIFQVFRFATFVMFAIFMVECSVFHNETSVDCNISTTWGSLGCGPYCWKGMWVGCSAVTCIIWLFVLCVPIARKHIREIRPASNASLMRSLVRKPYFWHLNFIVTLVVVYDAIILSQKHVSGSEEVEVGVILSKLLTTALIFQLNFTYPPRTRHFPLRLIALYYITLLIFLLDYLCKFVELSIRISYKLYTVNAAKSNRQMHVVGLILEVVDAALYNHFATFFWNKIFRGRSDVLMTYSPDLAQSLSVMDQEHTTSGEQRPLLHVLKQRNGTPEFRPRTLTN